MVKYKLVVFDLDGTLLNTISDITDALNKALKEEGFKEFQEIDVCYFVGNGVDTLIDKAMIAGNIDKTYFSILKDKYMLYYSNMNKNKTKPYDNILNVLDILKENNIKTAVLSNKPQNDTYEVVKHFFGTSRFDIIQGAIVDVPLKPNPTSLLNIIKKENVLKDEVLYIGDTNTDVKTAKNAGLFCLGASWGFRTKEELLIANADSIIDDSLDILDYLGLLYIPEGLKVYLNKKDYCLDDIGRSNNKVYIFDNYVLKISKYKKDIEKEIGICKWLQNKISLKIPKVIQVLEENNRIYFLMERIKARMLIDDYFINDPVLSINILIKVIKELHKVPIEDCPYFETIDVKLDDALYNINNERVDLDDFSENEYESPIFLYEKLKKNKPLEKLVFSHGDLCLPNIFAKDDKPYALIDFSRSGKGDIHQDLALCARSILYNFKEKKYVEMFLNEFNLSYDDEVIKYYIDLDELF